MIIIMSNDFTPENLSDINKRLDDGGLQGKQIEGTEKTVIAVVGDVYPELRDEKVYQGRKDKEKEMRESSQYY